MLTAMKLTGNIEDITAYHCRRENYYFKQGRGLAAALFPEDKGSGIISDEPLDYVSVRGQLASRLGFEDDESISEIDLSNLMSGRNRNGEKISSAHKVHAIDLTFSAPKSVSIAGLALKDSEVIRAHRLAVIETMKEIERLSCAQPRAGAKVPTGKMVWVQVDDGFSREKDPHLHTHCIVMNLTEHNGKIYALDGRQILKRDFNQSFGALYRAKLAQTLTKDNRLGITYNKAGEWRLNKVSSECERAFSTRRQQILEAESKGAGDLDAWRKTRKAKDDETNKADVLKKWADTLRKFNIKTESANREESVARRKDWARQAIYSVEAQQEIAFDRAELSDEERWQLALRRATETEATATKEELFYQYLCEKMRSEKWDGADYAGLEAELEEQVKSGNLARVGDYYTSWEMLRSEREYVSFAVEESAAAGKTLVIARTPHLMRGTKQSPDSGDCHGRHPTGDSLAMTNRGGDAAGQKRKLSPLQKEAVAKILSSPEQLVVVQGDAGAGKTSALKAVADIYKDEGFEVIGLCMQGVAAQKLKQETDVASFTLKSYFSRNPRSFHLSDKPRVIIFDEASMLDSRNAAKLFRSAKENGDKVILVGDRNQLESIAAGRVFERLCEIKEREGGLIEMNENFRQRDERLREAVDYARKGKMKKSLDILDKRGDIVEMPNKFIDGKNSAAERRKIIAKQYDKSSLIITGTQQARDELNLLIRTSLKSDGNLKKEKSFGVARTNREGIDEPLKMNIAEGELIVFTKNEYKNYDIRNGERATVVKLHTLKPHTLTVRTEDGRAFDIDTKKYKNIDYGYALTTYKAQGQTYDKIIVDADTSGAPALNDMRAQYVNITRARDIVKIYTDDKSDLKDLARRLEHKRDTLDRMDITLKDALRNERRLKEGVIENTDNTPHREPLIENPEIVRERSGVSRSRSVVRGR